MLYTLDVDGPGRKGSSELMGQRTSHSRRFFVLGNVNKAKSVVESTHMFIPPDQ